jgi:hypothetical protein
MKRTPKTSAITTAFAGLILVTTASHVSAQYAVSIDIQGDIPNTGGWYGTQGTYSGQGAPATGNNWNGVKAGYFEMTGPLLDDQGSATSISIWSEITVDGGAWSYAPGTGSPADALFGDYGFHNSGDPNRFTLFTPDGSTTGLQLTAGSLWDVYIYSRGDNAGQGGTFMLAQTSGDITLTASGQTWTGAYVEGDNYIKFSNVTPTAYGGGYEFNFLMDGNGAGGTGPAIINGIQLVQVAAVPEPSAFALMGIGLAALFIIRRRA